MPKKTRPPLVTVWWSDACVRLEEYEYDPAVIMREVDLYRERETSGYYIGEDHEKLILAVDYDANEGPNGSVGQFNVIWVDKITRRRGFPKKRGADTPPSPATSEGTSGTIE